MTEVTAKERNGFRVLLTGGSGFIGTHTVNYYRERGAEIMNIDIAPPLNPDQGEYWREQDILDAAGTLAVFVEFKPTHVIHLAARTDLDETRDINGYQVNMQGVRNVLEGVKAAGSVKHVIMVSTMFVCVPGYSPTSDEDYCPHTVYGESKVMTEKITREFGLDCLWTIVRPAVIWGPYHERLKAGFFSILGRGLYFHPGNTRANKSYGYVGNSVFQMDQIFQSSTEAVNKKIFYLADPCINLLDWGDGFSRELISKPVRKMPYVLMKSLALVGDIAVILGKKNFPMTSFRLKNMTMDNVVDTSGMDSVAWPLPYSMKDGIKRTVAWLKG